ncbi:FkbM family methyltransferase [Patescibacteria group bacterium]
MKNMKQVDLQFNNFNWQVNIRSQADKSALKEIFEIGEYKDVEQVIKSAKESIIDAGAQAGFFILYCRSFNLQIPIYAIEPDEANIEALEDHLLLNKIEGVEIIPGALAEKSGLRDFYISTDTHNHSLYKTLTPQITKTNKIKTFSLDDFLKEQGIERVSLLKLDIEGAEYEVLNNFNSWNKIDNIVLEYHNFAKFNHLQLEKLFKDNGYKIKITPSKFDKSLGFITASK